MANKEQNLALNKELSIIFESFDVDKDGLLTYEELTSGYSQLLGNKEKASA